ncbi:MAG: 6-phosphogluconolactonase, partial [Caulobacterales bacterium]
ARNLDPQSEAFAVAVPDRDPPRLSLTLSAILKAERVCLLIAGEQKRALLDAVARGEQADLPIASLLRHSRAAPTCYWGAKT